MTTNNTLNMSASDYNVEYHGCCDDVSYAYRTMAEVRKEVACHLRHCAKCNSDPFLNVIVSRFWSPEISRYLKNKE